MATKVLSPSDHSTCGLYSANCDAVQCYGSGAALAPPQELIDTFSLRPTRAAVKPQDGSKVLQIVPFLEQTPSFSRSGRREPGYGGLFGVVNCTLVRSSRQALRRSERPPQRSF
jgi:hypothetical protein